MASFSRTVASAAAIGFYLAGTAAWAEVTAQDVWADWKGYLTSSGYTVEASETLSGDTLNITGLTMRMDIPEDNSAVALNFGDMTFTDNGDGTVDVALPATMPIAVAYRGPDGEAATIDLEFTASGFAMTVSGDPGNMVYAYAAAEMGLRLLGVSADESLGPIPVGTAWFNMADLSGTTRMQTGDLRHTEQKMTTGAVAYELDFTDSEAADNRVSFKGRIAGMELNATGSLPSDMDAADMVGALRDGFAANATVAFRNGASDFSVTETGSTVEGSSSTQSGELAIDFNRDNLAYGATSTGMNVMLSGGDIPFPIELAMQEAGFNLSIPVASGDSEQDFAVGIRLGDFTMSEMIWALFDPGSQLPRDPATVVLDLSGKAKLFVDLFDTEQMQAVETQGKIPGELNALDVKALTMRVAGAELTGSGGFTFDNSDLTTFDGMPAPTGAVDLRLTGANGLLDKLVGMGLLPEDQAMGVRMMMGLFAVPGDGEDTLTSKVEVRGDGQVLANGQRLK